MLRNIRILGTGKYLPRRLVHAKEIDRRVGVPEGTSAIKTGVQVRHWVDGETAVSMGAKAALAAVDAAGVELDDIDAIICGNSVGQQPIPCNGALLHRELGLGRRPIPAFDVNSTCLSFVTALDVASFMVQAGQYETVLLVSSEVASVGLDFSHLESSGLFGDGAAAVVITKCSDEDESRIFGSRIETYSDGADRCRIVGGGSGLHPSHFSEETRREYLFQMEGPAVFRLAMKVIPGFMERMCAGIDVPLHAHDIVIPHQASRSALELVRRRLDIPPEKWMTIVSDHGNCVAASIPMALHEAITQGRIKRGARVLLFGTSAGVSVGGLSLLY